jgi:glycosyltransferase involved in cell wall biosynthesis
MNPLHTTQENSQMTIALCLLTWNEIDGVKHDIPLICLENFDQIYCIDAGSTDGTKEYLIDHQIPVYTQTAKGINQACIDAVNQCKCDAIVFFHPKGTIPVGDTYKFRAFFESGYEFIVASRMMKGGHNEEDSKLLKPRKWFVLALAMLSAVLFKREDKIMWDVLHGFRGIRVDCFKKLNISNFDRSIDIEMVSRAYKYHVKRIEFPTYETPRIGGMTHFKALSSGWQVLKYLWWELWRKD